MVTTVGKESTLEQLVTNLLSLEQDAISAYESTIERLDNAQHKAQVSAFREDHLSHVAELRKMALEVGADASEGSGLKELLTTGKVAIASLAGDGMILKAMKSNEDDTVAAYRQAAENPVTKPDWLPFLQKARADEERHRAWFETAAASA